MPGEQVNRGGAATGARADARAELLRPAISAARSAGAKGLAEFAAYLTEHGISTERGGPWRSENVRTLLQRLQRAHGAEFRVRSRSEAMWDRYQRCREREAAIRAQMRERWEKMKALKNQSPSNSADGTGG